MSHRPSDDELRQLYAQTKTIAVVGASKSEEKAAHQIPRFLQEQGYTILPVTPSTDEVLGAPTVPALSQLEEAVDVVNVFRPAEEAPEIAREAVALGAKALWLQEGIVSEEAAMIARNGGLTVVMDACIKKNYIRLGMSENS